MRNKNMMMVLPGLNTRRVGNTRGRAVLASALGAFLILSASFRLVRAASGDLDSSFGTGGKVTLAFPGANDVARATAIRSRAIRRPDRVSQSALLWLAVLQPTHAITQRVVVLR